MTLKRHNYPFKCLLPTPKHLHLLVMFSNFVEVIGRIYKPPAIFLTATKILYIPTRSFFAFLPVEIESEIMSLPNNKSYGLYFCPTFLLKCTRSAVSSPLAEILYFTIHLGKYYSKLKFEKVVPVFKEGDDTDPNNQRLISLLSNFNRIFEKLMYKRLES